MAKIGFSSISIVNVNDGQNGQAAQQMYNWIVYSAVENPTSADISTDPTNKKFIGFAYNKLTPTPSTNPSDYQWVSLDGHVITSMLPVYYSSTETDVNNIPWPSTDSDSLLYVSQGYVYTKDGYISFSQESNEWDYEKPQFVYGYHLWTSLEITTSDGAVIYSEPQISAEWEIYYGLEIGGTQLIRNSKTLIDERIYWRYDD